MRFRLGLRLGSLAYFLRLTIGLVIALAQTGIGLAQGEVRTGLAVADARAGALVDLLRRTLQPGDGREWQVGWQLAHDMGTSALPALERLFENERNPNGRLAILAAIAIAGDEYTDAFLVERLRRSTNTRERWFCLLCLALGPVRSGGEAIGEVLQSSTAKPAIRVVAALAARRYGLAPPASWYASEDPGIAAVARFCRANGDDTALERWLGRRRPHADLVLRGAMLGVRGPDELVPALEDRVRAGLGSDGPAALARCAAVCAARAIPAEALLVRRGDGFPAAHAIPGLAEAPAYRSALRAELTRSLTVATIEPADRARCAVALALSVPYGGLGEVLSDVPADARDARDAFALALAMRVYASPDGAQSAPVPDGACGLWVRVARGEEIEVGGGAGSGFARELELARQDRLPPAAAVEVLEAELWGAGWHPGRASRDAELELVEDLALAGSDVGRAVRGLGESVDLYLPKGLGPSDAAFEVATRFVVFMDRAERRPPAAHRLRR